MTSDCKHQPSGTKHGAMRSPRNVTVWGGTTLRSAKEIVKIKPESRIQVMMLSTAPRFSQSDHGRLIESMSLRPLATPPLTSNQSIYEKKVVGDGRLGVSARATQGEAEQTGGFRRSRC